MGTGGGEQREEDARDDGELDRHGDTDGHGRGAARRSAQHAEAVSAVKPGDDGCAPASPLVFDAGGVHRDVEDPGRRAEHSEHQAQGDRPGRGGDRWEPHRKGGPGRQADAAAVDTAQKPVGQEQRGQRARGDTEQRGPERGVGEVEPVCDLGDPRRPAG